jgi:carbon-monoxide dehydrogenase large subunit
MSDMSGHEAARVEMAADGRVTCYVSFPSQGQGHATTTAQLVADQLGVPLEAVTVRQPDTATAPSGTGTFASRGAIAQSGAADAAAATVRRKLLAIAGGLLEASPVDLLLHDGRVSVRGMPDRGVSVAEVARRACAPPPGGLPEGVTPGLEATQAFDPPGPTFSGAVHVAGVEVDRETGHVTVRDYVVVEDCGPVINPMIVEGPDPRAVAQASARSAGAAPVYDESGQLATGTLMDYALPVAGGLPFFTIGHLETPSPLTPGGYKGMGEGTRRARRHRNASDA